MSVELLEHFDVFLSHSHNDSAVVEHLAAKLERVHGFKVWLDKWVLVPGGHWQQEMARGLEQAKTCAVFVGQRTPQGWFREEIERALNRQTKNSNFRVIPVILPDGESGLVNNFLELRTWVEFKQGIDDGEAFHRLVSGIKGIPPGRYVQVSEEQTQWREPLLKIKILREEGLIDDKVAEYFQKLILKKMTGI